MAVGGMGKGLQRNMEMSLVVIRCFIPSQIE